MKSRVENALLDRVEPDKTDFIPGVSKPKALFMLAAGLSFVMSVAAALKLLLTLAYFGFVIACSALRRRLGGEARGEVLVAVDVAAILGPGHHGAAVGLEVALEAPRPLRDAERLVAAGLTLQQRHGAGRHVEGVLVPLHGVGAAVDPGEQRFQASADRRL